jgi:hemerythrin
MRPSSKIIWQETQHQMLFKLIDDIKEDHYDIDIFHKLHRYADDHFILEEEYMRQLSYPHIAEHIAKHNQFRDELLDLKKSCEGFDQQLRDALSLFLSEWLTLHIFGIDKKFEDFILKSHAK